MKDFMIGYKFKTEHLAISDSGIHLLRSNFNYKTIEFLAIKEIRIKKGRQINNWIITLIFGVLLIGVAVYVLYHVVYEYFIGTQVHRFYIQQFIFPVLPLFAGVYCLYVSLKNGIILQVVSNGGTINLPIEDLNKDGQIEKLVTFFESNKLTKYKFQVTNL